MKENGYLNRSLNRNQKKGTVALSRGEGIRLILKPLVARFKVSHIRPITRGPYIIG